jgi:hypothetical protein
VLRIFLFLWLPLCVLAQTGPPPTASRLPKSFNDKKDLPRQLNEDKLDSLSVHSSDEDISIANYLIISQARDTVHVDTTLTIAKYYKFNSQRRDNFAYFAAEQFGSSTKPVVFRSLA